MKLREDFVEGGEHDEVVQGPHQKGEENPEGDQELEFERWGLPEARCQSPS